jgi:type I restriction enzyme M protein
LSTSTATAYKYSVAGHLSFGAPKCEKAQKSSGFWADRTYWLCIKDNVLIDPAMGSAGFLLSSAAYVSGHQKNELMKTGNMKYYKSGMFSGFDTDQSMLRIGAMNMMLHGVEDPNIRYQDSLSGENTERDAYSLIMANPPFTGSVFREEISKYLLALCKTRKTELLFMALFVKMLKVGGALRVYCSGWCPFRQ